MSWIKTHSKVYQGITKEQVWKTWTDLSTWNKWNPGIDWAKIEMPFEVGNYFVLKPKNMRNPVKIQIIEVVKNHKFVDKTTFLLANMFGEHLCQEVEGGVKLTTKMTMTGFLSFLWIWLVGNKVAAKMEQQMDQMVAYILEHKNS